MTNTAGSLSPLVIETLGCVHLPDPIHHTYLSHVQINWLISDGLLSGFPHAQEGKQTSVFTEVE